MPCARRHRASSRRRRRRHRAGTSTTTARHRRGGPCRHRRARRSRRHRPRPRFVSATAARPCPAACRAAASRRLRRRESTSSASDDHRPARARLEPAASSYTVIDSGVPARRTPARAAGASRLCAPRRRRLAVVAPRSRRRHRRRGVIAEDRRPAARAAATTSDASASRRSLLERREQLGHRLVAILALLRERLHDHRLEAGGIGRSGFTFDGGTTGSSICIAIVRTIAVALVRDLARRASRTGSCRARRCRRGDRCRCGRRACSGAMYSGVPNTDAGARQSRPVAGAPSTGCDLGDAEVDDLHEVGPAVAIDEEHVLGLEVAVDDALAVRGAERARDLRRDVDRTRRPGTARRA